MAALACIGELTNLYEVDYDAWLQRNLELLRQFRFAELNAERRIAILKCNGWVAQF
ncbi:hypothetical protein CCP3SC1_420023 [Gammaproteobacteria bacterium]